MKILVVSDTHGYTEILSKLLNEYGEGVDLLCHAGDGCMDIERFKKKHPSIKMMAVAGNSDYDVRNEKEQILELEYLGKKVRILITHGHLYGVKRGLDALGYAAFEKKVDACFFGHTHNPIVFEKNGVLFLNPGSLGYGYSVDMFTYGFAEVTSEGKIRGELREISK